MEKQKKYIFNKDNYLLGINKEGEKVWLEGASWDCKWYWGFGYVEIYNKYFSDIEQHTHFNSLFLERNIHDSFKEYFSETVLSDSEIWKLLELMQEFYTLRKYSDLLHTKGAHITNGSEILKQQEERNLTEYKRINEELLPSIFEEVYKLLDNKKEEELLKEK